MVSFSIFHVGSQHSLVREENGIILLVFKTDSETVTRNEVKRA